MSLKIIKNKSIKKKYDEADFEYNENSIDTVYKLYLAAKEKRVDVTGFVHSYESRKKSLIDLDSEKFVKLWESTSKKYESLSFRESVDFFGRDMDGSVVVGMSSDNVPVLGGPFFKTLYTNEFLKQANAAFYAYNNDPIARAAVNMIIDFTLGRGFKVESDNKLALSIWRAFEKANNLQTQIHDLSREIQINGEVMFYKLPRSETKISLKHYSFENEIPRGLIPRVRLIDATNIWEIVTLPEDITEVLYYVWVAPTQWQSYTGLNSEKKTTSSKFIFQTIEAKDILHYKVNSFSNEKRGRSDLYPVLGYLKRLRDSVDFNIIALNKQSAWSFDTTIDGSQADIDAYMSAINALGESVPAGSEFVHSKFVKREILSPQAGRGVSEAFEWTLSMIAAGIGLPISYFGTHLSGGQTRASALVSTEPSAKKFEMRQNLYKKIIQDLWDFCMESFGIKNAECSIILPEVAVEDRLNKFRLITVATSMNVLSRRRAGEIMAKELQIDNYNFDDEIVQIEKEKEELPEPLSMPPAIALGRGFGQNQTVRPDSETKAEQKKSGLDNESDTKSELKDELS